MSAGLTCDDCGDGQIGNANKVVMSEANVPLQDIRYVLLSVELIHWLVSKQRRVLYPTASKLPHDDRDKEHCVSQIVSETGDF